MLVKCMSSARPQYSLAIVLSVALLILFSCQTQAFINTRSSLRHKVVDNTNLFGEWNLPPIKRIRTEQYLFNLPNLEGRTKSSFNGRKWIVTEEIVEELIQKELNFPYQIELKDATYNMQNNGIDEITKTVIIRHLEDEDLPIALRLIIGEYGSYGSDDSAQSESNPIMKTIDPFLTWYENYSFTWIVGLGLLQRIKRRKEGDSKNPTNKEFKSSIPDHNVLVIAEVDENGVENKIVGMAEISQQPPDPERSAPPYVLPMFAKKILAKFVPEDDKLCAYVSNVLIANEYRGLGYSKILMYACEGLATSWGYQSISLHVDAAIGAGREAQGLYRGLAYKPVIKSDYNSKVTWMGPEMINQGVFIVDGVPLIYLRKDLMK